MKKTKINNHIKFHNSDSYFDDCPICQAMKKAAAVLAKHQVPCLGCSMASFEMGELRLGDITKIYQLNLQALLKDLNK